MSQIRSTLIIIIVLCSSLFSFNCHETKEENIPIIQPSTDIVGDSSNSPKIRITSTDFFVQGTAINVDYKKTKVVVWCKTDRWYVQPTVANPYSDISKHGNWSCYVRKWNAVVALLVNEGYVPNSPETKHPANSPGVLAWDEKPTMCPPFGIIGDLSKKATILVTSSNQNLIKGIANNIDVAKIKVVLWSGTNTWYIQPWTDAPFTEICGDTGAWQNSVHPWWNFYALLVDSTYTPSATSSSDPTTHKGVIAWDKLPK